ncbi:MAG: tetratricopeptide repeat protein [Bacteroidales bacterium]|nr:tetratricopeptide repeat protein [Bacteroidales bacterium]
MSRISFLMLAALLAVMLSSCGGGSGKTAALLDEVESYMQQRPDSALSVLTAIPQESLRSDRLRARWSLLYAMALHKSYVDTTDVSVIAPAVKYYSRHGSPYDKMRSYHYQGVIYKNAEDYPNAIISLTEASKYIDRCGDYFQGGLVYSSLAHLYNRMYNADEELDCATKAYDCFVKADDHDYIQYARLMQAYALANLNRNDEAIGIYRDVLADNPDKANRIDAKTNLALKLLCLPEPDAGEAYRLFSEVFDETHRMPSKQMWGAYAYASDLVGDHSRADRIYSQLDSSDNKTSGWLARSCYAKGDYKKGFDYLVSTIDGRSKVLNVALVQATHKAQRDYAIARQEAAESHFREQRLLFFLLLMALIAASAIVYSYVKTRNLKLAAENDNLREIAETVEKQLESENTLHKEETQKLREDYVRRNKEYFKTIGQLCEAYLSSEDERASKRTIKRIRELASLVKDDSHQLENELNEKLDNVISDFKADYPEVTDNNLQLVCYLFAGFDATTISLLTGKSKEALYTQKSRIKGIISSKDCKDKDRYLLLIG